MPRNRANRCVRLVVAAMATMASGASAQVQEPPPAQLTGTLADGTNYRINTPSNFNGTVLLGLDFASSNVTAPATQALLAKGYAMAGTTRLVTGWDVAAAVANQVATLDVFEKRFGKARHAVVFGSSLGGHVGAAVVQAHPDRFQGAVLLCGGHAGTVGQWNSKLDALFVAKTLIGPNDAALPILGIPSDFATGARPAWIAKLTEAQKTPEGKARIALAAVVGQLPTWSVPSKPVPSATNIAALQEGLFDSLAGGPLPLVGQAMSSRNEIERRSRGNITSNEGVDYGALLARLRLAPLVRSLYQNAGLDLDADLRQLAAAPRVKADPVAVAWTAPGNWNGRVAIPVVTLNGIGDQISNASGERYYEQLASEAGYGANVRHLYTKSAGHCGFTTAEQVTAVDVLVERLSSGTWGDTTSAGVSARAQRLGAGEARFTQVELDDLPRPFPAIVPSRVALQGNGAARRLEVTLTPGASGGKIYTAADVDVSSVRLNGVVAASSRVAGRAVVVIFERVVLPAGSGRPMITGVFRDGVAFTSGVPLDAPATAGR
jgi:pimeloyl-ACP methyl ester carboxylesterase